MAPTVTTAEIARPPEEVFAYVMDVAVTVEPLADGSRSRLTIELEARA